jgi:hypothetical protein
MLAALMMIFTSCGSNAVVADHEVTMEEEIIEMNWNRAVKDLYWLEVESEMVVNEDRQKDN